MEFWYHCRANPRKSNHSYLRLLQASPAILLAWFTSNPKFSNRFCRKISSGSPLSLHRYGTRCGYDWGVEPVLTMTEIGKLCTQNMGFHLKLFHFYTVNIFFHVLFDICFRNLPGNLDHPDWIEWKESQESHVLGSKLPFLFPEWINSSTSFVGVYIVGFLNISIIRTPYTHYKDYLNLRGGMIIPKRRSWSTLAPLLDPE